MTTHFNAGNVWGVVSDHKDGSSSAQKQFLGLQVDCSGDHGQVTAFGNLWGDENIRTLKKFLEEYPGAPIRLRGYFSTFERDRKIYNFTWYKWEPAPGLIRKAAFVLRGKIANLKGLADRGIISMHLTRPGKGSNKDISEDFDIYSLEPECFRNIQIGQTWEAKGYLEQIEDDFGCATGPAIPIIKVLKRVEEK